MGLLRFLLAVSVIFAHAPTAAIYARLPLLGGELAVQCFFMISGFYISMILDGKYKDNMLFWSNRAFRIFPGYLLILCLSALVYYCAHDPIFQQWSALGIIPAVYALCSSVFLFGHDFSLFMSIKNDLLYFVPDFRQVTPRLHTLFLVPQAWTLALELYFYLLAPFLVRLKTITLMLVMAAAFVARVWAYKMGFAHDPWSFRFFPFEILFFLAGVLGYRIYKNYLKDKSIPAAVYCVMPALMLVFPLLPDTVYRVGLSFRAWGFLALFAAFIPVAFMASKNNKIDRFIGDLSYPMYLNHLLVLYGIENFMTINKPEYQTILMIAGSIIGAVLVHHVLEKPIDAFRAKRVRQATDQ